MPAAFWWSMVEPQSGSTASSRRVPIQSALRGSILAPRRGENCQVGVFVADASRLGQALIDRRLYLPEAWANDAARRQGAAVPETVACQTKPAIAVEMIGAALDAGATGAFVLADALYGADPRLRRRLEARQQPYVLATRSNHVLRLLTNDGLAQTDPRTLADALPPAAWAPHAAGEGRKGRACVTGRGSRCRGRLTPASDAGCCSGAAGAMPQSVPLILSSLRLAQASPSWPARPGCAGPSKRVSSAPRRSLGLIIARPGPGTAGTGI